MGDWFHWAQEVLLWIEPEYILRSLAKAELLLISLVLFISEHMRSSISEPIKFWTSLNIVSVKWVCALLVLSLFVKLDFLESLFSEIEVDWDSLFCSETICSSWLSWDACWSSTLCLFITSFSLVLYDRIHNNNLNCFINEFESVMNAIVTCDTFDIVFYVDYEELIGQQYLLLRCHNHFPFVWYHQLTFQLVDPIYLDQQVRIFDNA